ncbi:MAG: alkaline phosphatase family protein [Candidatus Sericytochromatia bacterium]|nr:alkaline phosphatase family protein [Candidatus Sericytochromatia bacterium]
MPRTSHRLMLGLLALTAAVSPAVAAPPAPLAALVAPPASPGSPAATASPQAADPTPAEAARTTAAFRDAAARSLGPRSGDLFALPAKYHYVSDRDYLKPETCTLPTATGERSFIHQGNHHGTFWDYDTRIPLAFWGPGRVRPAWTSREAVTQQDLVPTIANLIGAVPPEDAAGRVLSGPFLPQRTPPRVVLVLVFDQGGRSMLSAHPEAWPFIRRMRDEGAWYEDARVTHLDPETIVGHIAIGTGAYPGRHGVAANKPWNKAAGTNRPAVQGVDGPTPAAIDSPSLADVWLRQTQGRAVVIAQSLADRAAMGMVGHGALYAGNPRPICQWYDDRRGRWATQPAAYRLPEYLEGLRAPARWPAEGAWRYHPIRTPFDFKWCPGVAAFDGEAMRALLEREPLGEDGVTDLVFWSLKATDYVSHRFGLESLEVRDALTAVDEEARRAVEALTRRVGGHNLLVAFSADHGGAPLPELHGGARVSEDDLVGWLNATFDQRDNGVPLALGTSSTQIWLDDAELAANGLTAAQVRDGLLGWRPTGQRPFFQAVFTREEIAAVQGQRR